MSQPIFSKLHEDELLFIELFRGEPLLMTKGEFLKSDEWANYPYNVCDISIATSEVISFDLKSVIDQIGEDAYEEWSEQVWDSIKDAPETKTFLEFINKIFSVYKVYYGDKVVLMDMLPSRKKE